jgi:hypothetical protein
MSFQQWEGMPIAERYHRKLLFLAEIQERMSIEEERERDRWLDELEPPRPGDFRVTQ